MPPSGTPVKEAILDDIEQNALPLIVAGADYYTAVEKIQRIEAGPTEIKMFPAVLIAPLETIYNRDGTHGTLTQRAAFRIQLSLFLRTRTDAVSKIERFIRDVHKALMVDRTRNNLAVNTRMIEDEVIYPTEDDDPYTIANMIIEVDYRTDWDEPNNAT